MQYFTLLFETWVKHSIIVENIYFFLYVDGKNYLCFPKKLCLDFAYLILKLILTTEKCSLCLINSQNELTGKYKNFILQNSLKI